MTSIFHQNSFELASLSASELVLRIRSECCVFDLPPLVQALLIKMEEMDEIDRKIDAAADNAETIYKDLKEITENLDEILAFFDYELYEDETDETKVIIEKSRVEEFQNLLEQARSDISNIDPYECIPDL